MTSGTTVFDGVSPLADSLSLLLVQIMIIVILTRALGYLFRYIRQPTVIAEVIGGIILGPSALGLIPNFKSTLFPDSGTVVLTVFANFGLIFYLFMVGLELDVASMKKEFKKAALVSMSGMLFTFSLSTGSSYLMWQLYMQDTPITYPKLLFFLGICTSLTAFPVLARILSEFRLLQTQVGIKVISAAAIDDAAAWTLLAIVIGVIGSSGSLTGLYVVLLTIGFAIFMLLIFRKLLERIIDRGVSHDGSIEPWVLIVVFLTLMLSSFFTATIGVHTIFGAFISGLCIPRKHGFAIAVTEKIEDFVAILLLPLYFAASGLKTNLWLLNDATSWGMVFLVIFLASFGKIVACSVVSKLTGSSTREALGVGVLMNCKGLVELVILNIGLDAGVINTKIFTIYVLMAVFNTVVTAPLISIVYPADKQTAAQNEMEMIAEDDRKILYCLPGFRFVPTVMSMVQFLTDEFNIDFHLIRLVHQSERLSTLMKAVNLSSFIEDDPLIQVFKKFATLHELQLEPHVAMAAIDGFASTICEVANSNSLNFILLPFSDQDSPFDYTSDHNEHRKVILSVMKKSKKTVGVLIGGRTLEDTHEATRILVPFFGGPGKTVTSFNNSQDDREALKVALKMGHRSGVQVFVLRVDLGNGFDDSDKSLLEKIEKIEKEKTIRLIIMNATQFTGTETVIIDQANKLNPNLIIVGHLGPRWMETVSKIGDIVQENELTVNSMVLRHLSSKFYKQGVRSDSRTDLQNHIQSQETVLSVRSIHKWFTSNPKSEKSVAADEEIDLCDLVGELGSKLYHQVNASILSVSRARVAMIEHHENHVRESITSSAARTDIH